MIPRGVEVFIGVEPIDLRWGFDRLAGLWRRSVSGREARSGALFVFFGGNGAPQSRSSSSTEAEMCLFYKHLDQGDVPFAGANRRRRRRASLIDEGALDDLLDGIDVEPKTAKQRQSASALTERLRTFFAR